MSAGIPELLLLSASAAGACIAALFAIMAFIRTKQPAGILTKESATQVLRSETDIVRAAFLSAIAFRSAGLGGCSSHFSTTGYFFRPRGAQSLIN